MATTATAPASSHLSLQSALQRIELGFDHAFGARANPWRHLGAIAFYLFWIVVVTGTYLYAGLDTSVDGAYLSVGRMTQGQWPLGGVARSLHRYASDAFGLVVLLHVAREWIRGHASGFRWLSWLSGVPLLWLVYASGLGGFWLVWDRLAQFSLIATTEWLDTLPLFGESLTRNFIAGAAVTNRLFSLLIFLHIGIPLALLLGMWIHIQRISRAQTNPPGSIAVGLFAALTLLAVARPIVSDAPADLAAVPATLNLDWIYQAIHPLFYALSGTVLWVVAAVLTVALAALPWLPPAKPLVVANVDLANCNGCGRCFAHCPYVAVTMRPRSDGRALPREAFVDADLCAACGICAGACPSSTPFRSGAEIRTGIDLPEYPISVIRDAVEAQLSALTGMPKIVVFGCDCAAPVSALRRDDTATLSMPCSGMLPPSFVEYALRSGADGVVVSGCRDGDCAYRLGNRWTEARLRAQREPHLRSSVDAKRVRIAWRGRFDGASLKSNVAEFRDSLRMLPAAPRARAARHRNVADG